MAEVEAPKLPSLAEHYLVENKEPKPEAAPKSAEEVEPSSDATSKEIVEKIEDTSTADVSEEVAPPAEEESKESGLTDKTTEDNGDQESNDNSAESGNSDEQEVEEETPEIKLETAPADFRFPTTNQTRHCFTRYIEYHRCVAAKGEGAPECDKFAKYYRSLCPGEWIDRWNEQRENGTFPGPL
ncbi:cytochrome c oxidase [Striga asiatica]|uniref:Cytochrome c oxidase n=1 Tax=Striga asiatica TaxID=4170 RepID=A0A5A7Q4Y2_STRAF|nr:cytochrome c oxidase [Striga asiatica]